MKMVSIFGTVGIHVSACVFIGLGMGYYLDHKLFKDKTTPWFTLIFLGFGIFAGFKHLYTLSKRKDF